MIETFTCPHRMPYAYSNQPDPPSTTEPVVLAGDEITIDGPLVGDPVTGTVREVAVDGRLIWISTPGIAWPGGSEVGVVGVHRVIAVKRGDEVWRRS